MGSTCMGYSSFGCWTGRGARLVQAARDQDCHPWRKKRLGGWGRLMWTKEALTVWEVEAAGRESRWKGVVGMTVIISHVGRIPNPPYLSHNLPHKGTEENE